MPHHTWAVMRPAGWQGEKLETAEGTTLRTALRMEATGQGRPEPRPGGGRREQDRAPPLEGFWKGGHADGTRSPSAGGKDLRPGPKEQTPQSTPQLPEHSQGQAGPPLGSAQGIQPGPPSWSQQGRGPSPDRPHGRALTTTRCPEQGRGPATDARQGPSSLLSLGGGVWSPCGEWPPHPAGPVCSEPGGWGS